MLHQHPHLLVYGWWKLGIDFYKIRSYEQLVHNNAQVTGSGKPHYSTLKKRIVLPDLAPDDRWNPRTPPVSPKRFRGSERIHGSVASLLEREEKHK